MESVILKHLRKILNNNITTYCGEPAVFNSLAPLDTDEGWDEDTQYPRAIFELKMQDDPARKVSGQLYVDVMCENTSSSLEPEELSILINKQFSDCFFSTKTLTISARWNRSDIFKSDDDKVSGITLTFDILAYPVQTTTSPDPIDCVNSWLKTLYPEAKVIGKDSLPDVWIPTNDSPAIYCRILSMQDSPRMNSNHWVEWVQVNISINVIVPFIEVGNKMLRMIIEVLKAATRLILSDDSPMLIDDIKVNHEANPMREGQVKILATYGILREFKSDKLNHIYYKSNEYEEREVPHGE